MKYKLSGRDTKHFAVGCKVNKSLAEPENRLSTLAIEGSPVPLNFP